MVKCSDVIKRHVVIDHSIKLLVNALGQRCLFRFSEMLLLRIQLSLISLVLLSYESS